MKFNKNNNFNFPRWLFLTGRLPPDFDYFRCVVNVPEDISRVDEPSEVDGEQVCRFFSIINFFLTFNPFKKDERDGRRNE